MRYIISIKDAIGKKQYIYRTFPTLRFTDQIHLAHRMYKEEAKAKAIQLIELEYDIIIERI